MEYPSTNVIVNSRSVVSSSITVGQVIFSSSSMQFSLKNLVFSASTRKSSSSFSTFSSSSITDSRSIICSPSESASLTTFTMPASFFSSTKSSRIISAISGRCTFVTTFVPSFSTA